MLLRTLHVGQFGLGPTKAERVDLAVKARRMRAWLGSREMIQERANPAFSKPCLLNS